MAVWCVGRDGHTDSAFEAHFNYWRIHREARLVSWDENGFKLRDPGKSDFLETGIMLDDPGAVEKVCIFIPQKIALKDVVDCHKHFSDQRIAQGIFNEQLSVVMPGNNNGRFIELITDGQPFCRVHRFSVSGASLSPSELSIEELTDGTLLSITREAIAETCIQGNPTAKSYFRLRLSLPHSSENSFVQTIPTPDRLLQSGYAEIQYIDFRLNEARTLPDDIETLMRKSKTSMNIRLKLVAFLAAIPVLSEISASNSAHTKLRLLEHSTWNSYVAGGIPAGMVVYHWKKDAHAVAIGIADFSAFVKIQTRKSGRRTLVAYLAFAFIFGICGNLAAAYLQSTFAVFSSTNKAQAAPAIAPPNTKLPEAKK